MKLIFTIFFILVGFHFSNCIAEGIYKWTDENGETHYSSSPPDNNNSATEINLPKKKSNTISATPEERKRKQQNLLRALTEERQLKEEARKEKEKKEAQRKRKCMIARDRLKSYERANLIYNLNEKGERVYMSDKQRDRSVAEFKKRVNEWCN